MKRKLRCEKSLSSGSVAVEFAIIAPILIMGVLSTADVGFAIHESSKIDQTLRNGAQAALSDPGRLAVCTVLESVDPSGGKCGIEWNVHRRHVCPEKSSESASEYTTCANNRPTAILYEITGSRVYSGVLLPARIITRATLVQVR